MGLCKREFYIDYQRALAQLPRQQRAVFQMIADGEPQELVAQRIGRSKRGVEWLYSSAKLHLRRYLSGYEREA